MKQDTNEKVPPVKVGDVLTLLCEGKGLKGDGLFRHKGFVIFVKDHSIKNGKEYEIEITNMTPKVGFGKITSRSSD